MILVSVDFDYFVRELKSWDWGHSDENGGQAGLYAYKAWYVRYVTSRIDIIKETDPKIHADFEPIQLLSKFRELGLKFNDRTRMMIAESHGEAYHFFKEMQSNVMIHLDAHHDMYDDSDEITCGNWLANLTKIKRGMEIYHVVPKWEREWYPNAKSKEEMFKEISSAIKNEIKQRATIRHVFFEDLPKFNQVVEGIFFCRSGSWTPPHLDQEFIDMLKVFIIGTGILPSNIIELPLIVRNFNMKEIEETRKKFLEAEKMLREKGGMKND